MVDARKTTAAVSNRRRSRRLEVNGMARIECRKGALGLGRDLAAGRPLDLSETGMRLVLKEGLPPGAEVEVILSGGGLVKPLKRRGTVVWSLPLEAGGYCAGLNFDKPVRFAELHRLVRGLG